MQILFTFIWIVWIWHSVLILWCEQLLPLMTVAGDCPLYVRLVVQALFPWITGEFLVLLTHLFSVMQHNISYVLSASLLCCDSISRAALPYSRGCVCFIWTHCWPCWPQIMLKQDREGGINLRREKGKYLLGSVKAFPNRGDPSRAFKMSHPSLVHLHNL